MIAFGAVIGKATPTQLMWLMVALVGATHSSSMVSEFLVGVSASEAQR
jgi:Mg/Co/Ni transporter MgtE